MTYVPGVLKKLWLFPTLAFVLAVLGDILGYNQNWNIVTALASLVGVAAVGRLTGSKRTADGSHLASGGKIFLFMSLVQAALMTGAFFAGSYIYGILLFALVVWFTAMYVWNADLQVQKSAGEI